MDQRKSPPDAVLIDVYGQLCIPSDQIATEADAKRRFMSALPGEFRSADADQVAKRLVTLRKNGKLPKT